MGVAGGDREHTLAYPTALHQQQQPGSRGGRGVDQGRGQVFLTLRLDDESTTRTWGGATSTDVSVTTPGGKSYAEESYLELHSLVILIMKLRVILLVILSVVLTATSTDVLILPALDAASTIGGHTTGHTVGSTGVPTLGPAVAVRNEAASALSILPTSSSSSSSSSASSSSAFAVATDRAWCHPPSFFSRSVNVFSVFHYW